MSACSSTLTRFCSEYKHKIHVYALLPPNRWARCRCAARVRTWEEEEEGCPRSGCSDSRVSARTAPCRATPPKLRCSSSAIRVRHRCRVAVGRHATLQAQHIAPLSSEKCNLSAVPWFTPLLPRKLTFCSGVVMPNKA